MHASPREGRVQGGDGFPLAELVAGQGENLPPGVGWLDTKQSLPGAVSPRAPLHVKGGFLPSLSPAPV